MSSYIGNSAVSPVGVRNGNILPSDGSVGELFYNTVTQTISVFNGVVWVTVFGETVVPSGAFLPLNGINIGQLYFLLTENKMYIWDGSVWQPFQKAELGTVNPPSGNLGDMFYNIIDSIMYIWDGSTWNNSAMRGWTGSQGVQGPIGYTGSRGWTGSVGNTGFTGSRGTDGTSVSIMGSVPNTGSLPNPGTLGHAYLIGNDLYVWNGTVWQNVGPIRGPQGLTGFTGSIGFTGSEGEIGYTGSRGLQGIIGYVGSRGFVGSLGFIGYTGSFGLTGYTGSRGQIGFTGSKGEAGFNGSQGLIPSGTTAERPPTPVLGLLRYNTTTSMLEIYNGTAWVSAGNIEAAEQYAEDAQNAALAAQAVALYNLDTVDALRASTIVFPVGTMLATKDGSSFLVVAIDDTDYDVQHPLTNQRLRVIKRPSGWYLKDFTLNSFTGDVSIAFNKCRERAEGDVMISPSDTEVYIDAPVFLYDVAAKYDFNTTRFVCRAPSEARTLSFISSTVTNSTSTVIDGGSFTGLGRLDEPNTVGIYFNASNITLNNTTFRRFGHAREFGNVSNITSYSCSFTECNDALWVPTVSVASRITDYSATISNGLRGINIDGDADYTLYGGYIDNNISTEFKATNGTISVHGGIWKITGSIVNDSRIVTGNGGVSKNVQITFNDIDISVGVPGQWPNTISPIKGQGGVKFSNSSIYGVGYTYSGAWNPDGGLVLMDKMNLSYNPLISGDLGTYRSYNWNLVNNVVDDMGFVLSGSSSLGTRISPIEFTNAKLSRTSWASAPDSFGQSLRLAKGTSNSSENLLSMYYYAPVVGDEFLHLSYYMSDPESILINGYYLSGHYVEIKGYDSEGLPIIGKTSLINETIMNAPNTSWLKYSVSIGGFDFSGWQVPSPDWATHVRFGFNFNGINGSMDTSPEDGGMSSIYLSGMRISKWGLNR